MVMGAGEQVGSYVYEGAAKSKSVKVQGLLVLVDSRHLP